MQPLSPAQYITRHIVQGTTGTSRYITQRFQGAVSVACLHSFKSYSNYRSFCDPRRAFSSSFEHAFQLSSQRPASPRWLNKTAQAKAATDTRQTSHERNGVTNVDAATSNDKILLKESDNDTPAGSSTGSSSSAPPSSDGSDDSSSSPPPSSPGENGSPSDSAISKLSVPEVYPRLLALPIARRPLFPGFYKAVVVREPAVVAAMKDMLARGQPYLGAFLLKAGEGDSDVITDIDTVHKVGVFAQITSVFPASGSKDDKDGSLTVVLYPHRRIKITDLVPPRGKDGPSAVKVETAEGMTTPPSETTDESATNTCTCSILCVELF